MNLILIGAIAMASLIAGVFFLRFWRDTKDVFFLFFAASFILEAANRAALGLSPDPNEGSPLFYFVRLVSFLLIVVAIIKKNRGKKATSRQL